MPPQRSTAGRATAQARCSVASRGALTTMKPRGAHSHPRELPARASLSSHNSAQHSKRSSAILRQTARETAESAIPHTRVCRGARRVWDEGRSEKLSGPTQRRSGRGSPSRANDTPDLRTVNAAASILFTFPLQLAVGVVLTLRSSKLRRGCGKKETRARTGARQSMHERGDGRKDWSKPGWNHAHGGVWSQPVQHQTASPFFKRRV
jgi:hypothetical protein